MKRIITMVLALAMVPAAVSAFELQGVGAAGVIAIAQAADMAIPEAGMAEPVGPGDGPETLRRQGAILVPAKVIQLLLEQNSVDLAGYTAAMTASCSYKAGLFWPQSHSCGRRELPVEITADNRLLIPAVEAFEGLHGRDLKNVSVHIVVRRKDDAAGYLFGMTMRGKEALKAYVAERGTFTLLKLDAARVEVLLEGGPLAASPLAKTPGATLLSFVRAERGGGEQEGIMLTTPLEKTYSFDNRGGGPDRSLADFRALQLEGGVLIGKAGGSCKLELVTSLRLEGPDGETSFWDSRVEIVKTADGLRQVGQVALKRHI